MLYNSAVFLYHCEYNYTIASNVIPFYIQEIDSQQKLGEIQSSLFETFQGKCSCSISEDEIQNARFLCFEDPKYVVFRASLVANFITSLDCDEIVSTLLVENRKDTILVQDDQLSVDPSCVALLDSLDDEFDCKPTAVSPSRLTSNQSSTIIGVVVGGCVFLLLLLTVVVFAIVMFIRHRKRYVRCSLLHIPSLLNVCKVGCIKSKQYSVCIL